MRIEIKFSSTKYRWLCFKHAVEEAIAGEEIETEIDDFSGNYMGSTLCYKCSEVLDTEGEKIQAKIDHLFERLSNKSWNLRPKEAKPENKETIAVRTMDGVDTLAMCPKHKIGHQNPETNDCPMCHIEHEITNWRNSVQEMIMSMESRGLLNTEGVEKLSLVLKMVNELLEKNGKTN